MAIKIKMGELFNLLSRKNPKIKQPTKGKAIKNPNSLPKISALATLDLVFDGGNGKDIKNCD